MGAHHFAGILREQLKHDDAIGTENLTLELIEQRPIGSLGIDALAESDEGEDGNSHWR